jgi:hypothetical protein
MNKLISSIFLILYFNHSINAQITVAGSTGIDGQYPTLTNSGGVFQALNNNNAQANNNITINITGDILNEGGSISLTQGNWSNITISPTGNRTISGMVAGHLITLNGADNVNIDGINDGNNSLTIQNTQAITSVSTSTIRFIADASNNTITNCNILGSAKATSALTGNIFMSTGTNTGNDYITITNCNVGPIGSNYPSTGICSQGSNNAPNSNILINNCRIFDFHTDVNNGAAYGIRAGNGSTDWSITNNRFYLTGVPSYDGNSFYGIYFSNSITNSSLKIKSNIIGYNTNDSIGTLNLQSSVFNGIYVYSDVNLAEINNNIISNITSNSGEVYGLRILCPVSADSVLIDSNIVKNISTSSTQKIYGIYSGGEDFDSTGATNLIITNNVVDNIARTSQGQFVGIGIGYGNDVLVANNVVKNLAANNINATSNMIGIDRKGHPVNLRMINNEIYNLTTTSTSSINIIGIREGNINSAGYRLIESNLVHDFFSPGNSVMDGIKISAQTTESYRIRNNKIYNIQGGMTIIGLDFLASTDTAIIANNKIYNLTTPAINSNTKVLGLNINQGGDTAHIYNNIIGSLDATGSTHIDAVVGLKLSSSAWMDVSHNTIFLNTASASTTTFGSSCVYLAGSTKINLRNNILTNLSTPAQESLNSIANGVSLCIKAQPIIVGNTPNYLSSSNNNAFYCNASLGSNNHLIYGKWEANTLSDIANNLSTFQSLSFNSDQQSIEENPNFLSLVGNNVDYLDIDPTLGTALESGAQPINGIAIDYNGSIRFGNPGYIGNGSAPDIGAYEFESTFPTSVITPDANLTKGINFWSNGQNAYLFLPVENKSTAIFTLYDLMGKEVLKQNVLTGTTTEINLPEVKGIYLANVFYNGESYTVKVLAK